MAQIYVDEQALRNFNKMFSTAASQYKSGYDKLSGLIDEATTTGVREDLAARLKELYERKKPTFEAVYKEVNKAQGYAEHQISQFKRTMDNITSEMR